MIYARRSRALRRRRPSSDTAHHERDVCDPSCPSRSSDSAAEVSTATRRRAPARALAHEIAHVIRRDPAWRILVGTIERTFFFQPLNRVARAKLCDSAEFLCDQWAVQQTRSPLALARCLSIVASWASPASDRISAGASTMARGDSPIVRRVTRILNEAARPARRPSAVWLAPPLAVVAMAAPLVAAELSPRPPDWPRRLDAGNGDEQLDCG